MFPDYPFLVTMVRSIFDIYRNKTLKIDFDATYFKLHSIIIKFPNLEIPTEWGGGFT